MKKQLLLVLALWWGTSAAAETLWHMPTPYGDRNFHTANVIEFANQVSQASNGEFLIKTHSAGSLFKHPEIATVVRLGLVPIGELLMSRLGNENPLYELDSIPFLASNYEQAYQLWQASRPEIEKVLGERGMKLLFAVPWPPQGLYASRELSDTSDMAGLRVRAYNRATEQIALAVNAVPTQVEVPDIPTAFSTGRVDAMITSPSTGANTQAWDYVSHYYPINAFLVKNMVVVNQQAFDSLTEEQRQILLDAAGQAERRGWQASREETERTVAIMAEKGMSITQPTAYFMEQLHGVGEQMIEEWLNRSGDEGRSVIDAYRKLSEADNQEGN